MDEWAVYDTVDAELVDAKEVIRFTVEGVDTAGEVISAAERPDGSVIIIVEADLDGERHELTYQWDDQVDVLFRDYSGVEV